jgi:FkbM family methyltransferase
MVLIKRLAKSVMPKTTWAKLSAKRAAAERGIRRDGLRLWMQFEALNLLGCLTRFLPNRAKFVRKLKIDGYRFPVYYRVGTSDIDVIREVLIRRQYECVAHEPNVALIIDCGANIGCASYFLLHHYPQAQIIVVEPDIGNFAMCRRNLKPFGDRAILVNSGIWPTATPLRVARGYYGDGREWSFQVLPASENEPFDLMGTTVSELIDVSGQKNVDLLKIDIEGAELQLFSANTEEWLRRTRCLVIELHDTECERVFSKCMAEYCSEFEKTGELTICRNETSLGLMV